MPESAIKFGSYEVESESFLIFYHLRSVQASKRILARLEGHNDPKALHPWTQFLAAGMGGMFSQSVNLSITSHELTVLQICSLSPRYPEVVSYLLGVP